MPPRPGRGRPALAAATFIPFVAILTILRLSAPVAQTAGAASPAAPPATVEEPVTGEVIVTLAQPRHPYWVGRVVFEAEITVPAGDSLSRVEFFLDGSPIGEATRPPWRIAHDFGDLFVGHRLSLVAHTRSGATGSAQTVSLGPGLEQQAGVSLVLAPVSVRDAEGLPVRDLSRGEFTLLVDGTPRAIASFDSDPTPVSVVFGLDCSMSMRSFFPVVKASAVRFVQDLPPFFGVSLLGFGETVDRVCDFTHDRKHLFYLINDLRAVGVHTALIQAARGSVSALGGRPGRRVAVIFTDGQDTVVPEEAYEEAVERVIAEARAEGVLFYFVGYGAADSSDTLDRIAAGTGGEFVPAGAGSRISAAFDRIAGELNAQYTLGFEPLPGDNSGAWHDIEVRVSRPGLTVASRPGFSVSPREPD